MKGAAGAGDASKGTRLGRIFHDTLSGYLRDLSPRHRRFWILVPLTGVMAGLATVVEVHLLRLVQHITWGRGSEGLLEAVEHASRLRRVSVPFITGAIVVAVGFIFRAPNQGHGTSHIIESIWLRSGRVQLRWATLRGMLTIVVVGMGASLGREGALIYFGAAAGSWLGRRAHLDPDQTKLLVACGASAGLAAAYNTPIGAALFGLEVFLGGLALELLGPVIFASVAATLVSRALLFDHPSYVIPRYRLNHPIELLLYLLLGVFVGVISAGFVRTVEGTTRLVQQIPQAFKRYLPILGVGSVGIVGLFSPHIYGNGYDTVNLALVGQLPLRMLLVLPWLKLLVSALCASSGAPGGLFTPSMYVGGLAGAAFGVAAHHLFPHIVPTTGGYVLVGMASILAGSTHATLSAAILLFELTGSYDVILPLLSASVISTAVSRALRKESIYTAPLRRRGVALPRLTRPAWMQREGVAPLVRPCTSVRLNAPLEEVLLAMVKLPESEELFVVDGEGKLAGAIALETVREVLAEQPDLSLILAADVMHRATTVSMDASLWEVTRRALAAESSRLPVMAPQEGGRFVGAVTIADVLQLAAKRDG